MNNSDIRRIIEAVEEVEGLSYIELRPNTVEIRYPMIGQVIDSLDPPPQFDWQECFDLAALNDALGPEEGFTKRKARVLKALRGELEK